MACPFRCSFKAETYLAKVHDDLLQGRDSTVSTNTKTCNFHFLLPPSHKCYYFTLVQPPFPFSLTELPRIVFHKPHGIVNAAWVVSFWIGRVFIHLNPSSQTFLFVQLCALIGRYHTNHCLSGQWPVIAVYSIFKREIDDEIVEVGRGYGITIVALFWKNFIVKLQVESTTMNLHTTGDGFYNQVLCASLEWSTSFHPVRKLVYVVLV